MSGLLKIGLWLVGAFLAIAVALAVAVAFIFEPEDYRPYIIEVVEQSTGRSFDLGGDLGLKLFPCCGVAVGGATLGNPPGFPAEHFARIEAGDFSLEIWPLLSRREIRIGQVTLDGLDLALLRLADGRENWVFEDRADESSAAPPAGSTLGELSVAGIRVRGAKISYRDQQTGDTYLARDIELETGPIASLGSSEMSLDFETSLVASDEADGTMAHVKLSSNLSLAGERAVLRGLQMEVDASGPQVPARRVAGLLSADDVELAIGERTGLKSHELKAEFQLESPEGLKGDVLVEAGLGLVELDMDAMTGRLSGLRATLKGFDSEIRLGTAGEFGGPEAALSGDVEFRKVGVRKVMSALGLDDFRPVDGEVLSSLTGSTRWTLGTDRLALQEISLRLDESELTGTLAIQGFEKPATRFDLVFDRIDSDRYLPVSSEPGAGGGSQEPVRIPLESLRDLNVDGKLLIRKLRASNVDLADVQLSVAEKQGRVDIGLGGKLGGGSFRMEGRGDVAAAEPNLGGSLTLEAFSPRELLKASGQEVETADPSALSSLSGTTRWQTNGRSLSFTRMNWRLDQTSITGDVAVEDLDSLALRFDLNLDRMNLDNYLAPDDGVPQDQSAGEIPVEMIRDLQLDGKLTAGQITVAKLNLQNLSALVQAADGVLRLDPLQASLYGGTYRGVIHIDATGPKARLNLDQQLSAVQVGDMLQNFYGSDRLAGSLTLQLSGSGAGSTQAELLKALSGNVAMTLSDGVYRGMDIVYEVQRAQSLLRQQPLPAAPEKKETSIRALSFAGEMADGVLGSDQLSAEIPFLKLAGKGGINLMEMALDYQLNAQVLRSADSADARNLADLANTTIPLAIKGPMASPRVSVDLKSLVTTTIRDSVQERARDAVLKRLGGSKESANSAPQPASEGQVSVSGAIPAEPAHAASAAATDRSVATEAEAEGEQSVPAQVETVPNPEPEQQAPTAAEPIPESKPESTKDLLKRGLKDLLKAPPATPAPN